MKRLFYFVLAFTICLLVVSETPAADPLIRAQDLSALGYYKHWDVQLELNRGGFATTGYLLDDSIYVVTGKGDVHAFHAEAGLPRWSQNLTESVYEIFAPSHFVDPNGKPLIVFSTTPRTVIIDRYRGDIVADMPLDKATASPTVADADNIYFGSFDGHMYAMRWNDPRVSRAVLLWKAMAGGPVTSIPVLINEGNDLVFASQGGKVFNCTSGFKILNWEFSTGGAIIGDVFVDASGTFVASTDRSLYRVATASGVARWRVRFPEPLHRGPVVAARTVYQYCIGEGITAVDADSGRKLWKNKDAQQFLCQNTDHVYLMTADHQLLMVDVGSGKTVRSIKLPSDVVPIRNTVDETIYLVSAYGQLFCAKPIGTPHLTTARIAKAHRELYAPSAAPGAMKTERRVEERLADKNIIDPDDPLRSPKDTAE